MSEMSVKTNITPVTCEPFLNTEKNVCVFAVFLSVYVLTSANWDAVGHASVWNERSRAVSGQSSEESGCVFYRHKDNPSVSDTHCRRNT